MRWINYTKNCTTLHITLSKIEIQQNLILNRSLVYVFRLEVLTCFWSLFGQNICAWAFYTIKKGIFHQTRQFLRQKS